MIIILLFEMIWEIVYSFIILNNRLFGIIAQIKICYSNDAWLIIILNLRITKQTITSRN